MEAKHQLDIIKAEMLHGIITYEQAKAKAQPFLQQINDKAKTIAKKYGKRPVQVTFAGVMR